MKDTEKLTLQAFLFSLSQQTNPLPEEIQGKLTAIASSLGEKVMYLDELALGNDALAKPYQDARAILAASAGKTRLGLEVVPNYNPSQDKNPDIDNITRMVKLVDKNLNLAQTILADKDSVTAIKKQLES